MAFLAALCVMMTGMGYMVWRLVLPARSTFPLNITLSVLLLVPFLVLLWTVYHFIMRSEAGVAPIMVRAGYLSMGFLSIVLIFLLFRDLIWFTTFLAQKGILLVNYLSGSEIPSTKLATEERRFFLLNSLNVGTIGLSVALTGFGAVKARELPSSVHISIPVTNLPEDLKGFRIAQITDLHIGNTIKRDYVQAVVDRVNSLDADIIVFTGDLVDGSVSQLRDDASPLKDLKARYGNYFVTGNHEYYSGVTPWLKEAEQLGFDVLLNEHRMIQQGSGRLLLAGVTDYTAGRMMPEHKSDPAAALVNSPESDFKILLAHQPKSLFAAQKVGFDLQLSGHTHGGQYFPFKILARLGNPYLAGLHKFKDTWIYVSRGTGYWGPPIRTGAPSEITLITLTA